MLCFSRQPSPIQIQEINSFIDQDGLDVEVVCASFRKAADIGANYGYARSILNSWINKGIRTLEDVINEQISYEKNKQNQRQKTRRGYAPKRTELLPDWFDETENKSTEQKSADRGDIAEKKRSLQETLKQLREQGGGSNGDT